MHPYHDWQAVDALRARQTNRILLIVFLSLTGYLVANACAIMLPFIPSETVLWCWSVILPVAAIAGTWVLVAFHRHLPAWRTIGISATLAYLGAGLGSFMLIIAIWGSI